MNIVEKIELIRNIVKAASLANQVFTVEFVKKDGSPRMMVCQRDGQLEAAVKSVPDHATIVRQKTLASRNMMTVIERTATGHQWRTLNLAAVRWISYCGSTYQF